MKNSIAKNSIFWGIVLILTAVALILDNAGVSFGDGFSVARIVGGIVLLAWIVSEIVRGKFNRVFFPLAFLFFLFEEPIALNFLGRTKENTDLINNWIVILAALLLTVGFSILLRKSGLSPVSSVSNRVFYVEASGLTDYKVRESVGKTEVYVTNRDRYEGNGQITVEENVGKVVLHLPRTWTVVLQKSDNLGSVQIPPQDADNELSITLAVHDNVGSVEVIFD